MFKAIDVPPPSSFGVSLDVNSTLAFGTSDFRYQTPKHFKRCDSHQGQRCEMVHTTPAHFLKESTLTAARGCQTKPSHPGCRPTPFTPFHTIQASEFVVNIPISKTRCWKMHEDADRVAGWSLKLVFAAVLFEAKDCNRSTGFSSGRAVHLPRHIHTHHVLTFAHRAPMKRGTHEVLGFPQVSRIVQVSKTSSKVADSISRASPRAGAPKARRRRECFHVRRAEASAWMVAGCSRGLRKGRVSGRVDLVDFADSLNCFIILGAEQMA